MSLHGGLLTKLYWANDGQDQGVDFPLSLLLKQYGLSEALKQKIYRKTVDILAKVLYFQELLDKSDFGK